MDFFIIAAVGAALCWIIFKEKQYKETSYYRITRNSYWFMDKGTRGEYLLYQNLRHFENTGSKFLFNIFLPKGHNKTTEIDVLLITTKGIFVFESKNYSGWIFGNEAHKNWTQVLPAGRRRSHKERFYNPVMQNASHITHLKNAIGIKSRVWSIIAFSDECTLKDITITSENVRVTHMSYVASAIKQITSEIETDVLSEAEVSSIYSNLLPYAQASRQIKEQHGKDLHSYLER